MVCLGYLRKTWINVNACGVLKCWKESFMELAASEKKEGGQHIHGWKNVSLVENEAAAAPPPPVVMLENGLMT